MLSACSTTQVLYGDWETLHQKYGVTAFVTVPLDVAAGVVGTLTAAGGLKLSTRAVKLLAARLAEVLLRRTSEGLLQVHSPSADAADSVLSWMQVAPASR